MSDPSYAGETPLIELRNIIKEYGGDQKNGEPAVRVLHELSLSIQAGEFVAIIGTSGSGKSTLMNILGCLDRPSSGEYLFAGQDVAHFSSDQLAWLRRSAFGFIFQSYHLIPSESAAENVAVPALYAGMPESERLHRAAGLLERLGLEGRLNYLPKQLSGGQQQRVSIARALMNGGSIILADEPTGALDTQTGIEVMALLRELAEAGHTVILITHDTDVAAQAKRIIEVRDGNIIGDSQQALEAEVLADYANPNEPVKIPDPATADTQQGSTLMGGLLDASRAAKRAMLSNPIRTMLTLLGIIIGVAAVIVMLSIAEGAKQQIAKGLGQFGTNLMYLNGRSPTPRAPEGVISDTDMEVLRRLPEVDIVEPTVGMTQVIRFANADFSAYVRGNSADFPFLFTWSVTEGRFFSKAEYQRTAAVAVIGEKVRERLFGATQSPLGQFIIIGNDPFQVVGVLGKKDNDDTFDQNAQVIIPYVTAVTRVLGPTDPSWVSIAANESYDLAHTEAVIHRTLLNQHKGVEDFDLNNNAALLHNQQQIINQVSLLLGAIAAVSLLVGGIGVMNVMLMSVRERTKEIGIRMATGARQRDIMRQFLTESILVSLVGGAIGIVFSFALLDVALLLKEDLPIAVVPSVVLGAFACALLTGAVFGFAPAKRAAKMTPVQALNSE